MWQKEWLHYGFVPWCLARYRFISFSAHHTGIEYRRELSRMVLSASSLMFCPRSLIVSSLLGS